MNGKQHEQSRTHFLLEEMIVRHDQVVEALTKARDELASTNGIVRRGAEPREITNGASRRISTSAGQLAGWSVRESAGIGSAIIRLRDGSDNAGALIAVINLAANGTSNHWLLPNGAAFTAGLFVEVVTTGGATVEGVVHIGPFGRS